VARIDPDRTQIVIRLVYDGPAKAGKTTSLRRLAESLGVTMFSGPEEEGRTLYFDWLDYVGGLYDGMPIRCQVVSAPGQQVLESRRRLLLQSADAVIFVADSRPERTADNRRAYATLQEIAGEEPVPIGIVIQANKRDLPGALSLDDLRDTFGNGLSLAMTEAVAERGEGVRETFVLGIRLALDRVRVLRNDGLLPTLPPEFENATQLLTAMTASEGEASHASPWFSSSEFASSEFPSPDASQTDADSRESQRPSDPRPPDASIPPGLVWPPVQGRVVVHEAARDAIHLHKDESGAWHGVTSSGRWAMYSAAGASFRDVEEGREALIAWARWHSAASARLSAERAIVLAPAGPEEWRLWQIVHASPTLHDLCRDLAQMRGPAAGEKLFELFDLYAQAFEALVSTGFFETIALDMVAVSANGAPVYTGAAAWPLPAEPQPSVEDYSLVVERDLLAALRASLSAAPEGLSDLLAGIEAAAARRGRMHVAQSLRQGLLDT
jgi:signal recognition particle receptor subunit beta